MTLDEIRALRLHNQRITAPLNGAPERVVAHLGAMQAQEYAMAKWAVGLRADGAAEGDVEAAFADGRILRTHLLRPTWHFVSPGDIRDFVRLTAPQVHRVNGSLYRKNELDAATLTAACAVIERELRGGARRTREQLAAALGEAGIIASGHRLSYIMMYAELACILCSGARSGKQFTYALMDELVPSADFYREAALGKLAERYFASRGPATARDFAYWSGLSLRDARAGVASLSARFVREPGNGEDYILPQPPGKIGLNERATFLLPDYDEYGMGYKDRSALAPRHEPAEAPSMYSHWLVLRGRIEGTWQTGDGKSAAASVSAYYAQDAGERREVDAALCRYQTFSGK